MKIKDLKIQYKNKLILENINFEVNPGDVLGIIGTNGVGKSTLIKVLSNIITKYEGIYENDFSIGYVPQYIALYENLTVYENIKIFSSMVKLKFDILEKKIEDILQRLDLLVNRDTKVKKLSGGNKRRVNIAAALVNDPDCLIMDEPEVGIDYKVRRDIEKIISDLAKDNKAIIISSHSKDFIKNVSSKVLILENKTQRYYGDANEEFFTKL